MTVRVWIVTKRRECVRPTQDMAVGLGGPSGAHAVSHAVVE